MSLSPYDPDNRRSRTQAAFGFLLGQVPGFIVLRAYFPEKMVSGALAMLLVAAVCAWFAFRYGDEFWRSVWS